MFEPSTYIQRRNELKKKILSGIILIMGNNESPMNYTGNTYHFRQDSNFLYFFGIDLPGLAGIIDLDENCEIIFGDDPTIDDIVWIGPVEPLIEKCQAAGVLQHRPFNSLADYLKEAHSKGRRVHYLPPYREERVTYLQDALKKSREEIKTGQSVDFIRAVASLRSIKDAGEIKEMEETLSEITYKMYRTAMDLIKPGIFEHEISGAIEGVCLKSDVHCAYPVICSIHGEVLHNHYHGNKLEKGDLLLIDAGAESRRHYATDITRTYPVAGSFSQKQQEIYELVLKAEMDCIGLIKPGIPYKDIHLAASNILAEGLKDIGLMKGNMEEAVQAGAHALFFPHGIGHMLGLDVHDMEDLGEKFFGYDEEFTRSEQFGTAYLRLAKKLQAGYVITVEPGIYFIPVLIDKWRSERKFEDFINYSRVMQYMDFGGIRIEDNVLVTPTESRILGKPIPKLVKDIIS